MRWFGVKTFYRTEPRGEPKGTDGRYAKNVTLVEERVVVLKARGFDEAIKKAEREAKSYAKDRHRNPYGQQVVTRYLGYCDAYDMSPEKPDSAVEVYSATEVVEGSVSNRKILARCTGYSESVTMQRRRSNFLDIVFSGPAPGVRLNKKELAFVEKYRTLRRRPKPDA